MSTEDDPKTPGAAAPAADEPYMVDCVKFGKRMPGLTKRPLKGDLGERIYQNISQDGWRMWLEHSKMLINEYRLDLLSEQGQKVWMTELEKYFWGEGSTLPPEFTPGGQPKPPEQPK